jgi:hypothetical protein
MFLFIDVDMSYKSVHLFLYQLWRVWNAIIAQALVSGKKKYTQILIIPQGT